MLKGTILIIFAELFLTISTVFTKYLSKYNIPAIEISFFRFLFGLFFITIILIFNKKTLKPNNIKFLILRGVFNTLAVMLFFLSIYFTTLSKANLLNMTYPFFVLIISLFINREEIRLNKIFFLVLSFIGIYLVIKPEYNLKINYGDILGILSAIMAGAGISSLREANKYDNPNTILFFLFLVGTLLNGIVLIKSFVIPNNKSLIFLLFASISGVIGQIFLTNGYKYIEASIGSIVSTIRIVFSVLISIILFSEIITLNLFIGIILIIFSIICINLINYKKIKSI